LILIKYREFELISLKAVKLLYLESNTLYLSISLPNQIALILYYISL